MISVRHAPNAKQNKALVNVPSRPNETNSAWMARAGVSDGILLLGGTSLTHFRLRVAQSHLRRDMMPSFWSLAGLLRSGTVDTVPFESTESATVPASNGVQSRDLGAFDDPVRYPNIAVVTFGVAAKQIADGIERVRSQRSLIDLPRMIVLWLGYVWGAGQNASPLLEGVGVPSAAFVETVYALAEIELTPGLSSQATCPEAIWQTAKWWRQYYEEAKPRATRGTKSKAPTPAGKYATRQRSAAIYDPADTES